ncbi:(2Fe-2S)-binding protein [Neobacillus niacini]|uniref:(2Fe-2S)-binding protein n=1 Tax=Neobacillus niacini TaxID=86668 RepID=UPI0030011BE8
MKSERITLNVNGENVTKDVEPRLLLSDFIRDEMNLTGTHVGCEHGVCGACTISLNGDPVRSCLMLAVQAAGSSIKTVESLAHKDGSLNDLQTAFSENHALQCGFCTSGFLMVTDHFIRENPNPTDEEIQDAISGNLCRCTGYTNIIKAVKQVTKQTLVVGSDMDA